MAQIDLHDEPLTNTELVTLGNLTGEAMINRLINSELAIFTFDTFNDKLNHKLYLLFLRR